ncbi:hypothetical protein K440DRAFT_643290 [Wilcoxina mikolae CBS 423.85]|nr:hypothetical protein K440DRAFT_643290 [Wilcoxina mikolae CBS 423.85]
MDRLTCWNYGRSTPEVRSHGNNTIYVVRLPEFRIELGRFGHTMPQLNEEIPDASVPEYPDFLNIDLLPGSRNSDQNVDSYPPPMENMWTQYSDYREIERLLRNSKDQDDDLSPPPIEEPLIILFDSDEEQPVPMNQPIYRSWWDKGRWTNGSQGTAHTERLGNTVLDTPVPIPYTPQYNQHKTTFRLKNKSSFLAFRPRDHYPFASDRQTESDLHHQNSESADPRANRKKRTRAGSKCDL